MNIVHTESSCAWGGQEIRVLSEMAGMMARGHRMLLLCPAEARIFAEANKRGIPVEALPIGRKRIGGVLALRRRLRDAEPDVVVTHSSTDSWLAALASKFFWRKGPHIVRVRHISAPVRRGPPTRWLYGKAAARIVTTGKRLRDELIRDLDLPPTHVVSVPTGIDLARYAPGDRTAARRQLGLAESAPIVGIVATLRSWKGHRYLLEAFAKLGDGDVQLVIVGDGPGRDNLRRQAADLGIDARVVMPGNREDVGTWLSALDVFVLPSYANEGVPQAIMQAQASGLPVITTPVGSISEIVVDRSTGLLVPPRDVAKLRDALAELLGDAALRRRLGDAALAQARERYSEARMLDRMEEVFRGVVGPA